MPPRRRAAPSSTGKEDIKPVDTPSRDTDEASRERISRDVLMKVKEAIAASSCFQRDHAVVSMLCEFTQYTINEIKSKALEIAELNRRSIISSGDVSAAMYDIELKCQSKVPPRNETRSERSEKLDTIDYFTPNPAAPRPFIHPELSFTAPTFYLEESSLPITIDDSAKPSHLVPAQLPPPVSHIPNPVMAAHMAPGFPQGPLYQPHFIQSAASRYPAAPTLVPRMDGMDTKISINPRP